MRHRNASFVLFATALLATCACIRDAPTDPLDFRTSTYAGTVAGLRFVEVASGGAALTERLPMIVGLHGLGDTAPGFVPALRGLDVKARIILLEAPHAWHDGFAWCAFTQTGFNEPELAAAIDAAAGAVSSAVADLAAQRPTVGRPIITGFSQGAMVAFAVAAYHPGPTAEAYPVAGLLPLLLYPAPHRRPRTAVPITALHASGDTSVPFSLARESIDRLRHAGVDARLIPVEASSHAVTGTIRSLLHSHLREAIARQSAPSP